MSQRELAALAGVPCSTLARAESGRNAPSLATFGRLLGAAGYGLALIDAHGQLLRVDERHDRIRNRAGHRFPAHLPWGGKPDPVDGGWWGWYRIAWYDDGNLPNNVYWQRRRPPELWRGVVHEREIGYLWDDAT